MIWFQFLVSAMVVVSSLALVPVTSLAQPNTTVAPETLFSFDVDPITHNWLSGRLPEGPLVEDSAHPGVFYGTTLEEGDREPRPPGVGNCCGTIFKVDTTTTPATTTVIYSFGAPGDGAHPLGALVWANGYLWGITTLGGPGGVGSCCGTLFRINPNASTPADTFGIMHYFGSVLNDGLDPEYGLVKSSSTGKLYGTTRGGGFGFGGGTIFEIDPSSPTPALTYTGVHSFGTDVPFDPFPNGLMEASDGKLYGSTQGAGGGAGFVFAFDPSPTPPTFNTWGSFAGTQAFGLLAEDVGGGVLYGTTRTGGANNFGTVFSFDKTTHAFVNLYDFDFTLTNGHGSDPRGLVMGSDGTLYGTTLSGGIVNGFCAFGNGTIFNIKPRTTPSPAAFLYDFHPTTVPDGCKPYAGLIEASDGKLYGTTQQGGFSGNAFGTVFRIDKASLVPWVSQLGSLGKRDQANGVATGPDPITGKTVVYVVGETASSFGVHQGLLDAFVAKYKDDGTLDTSFGLGTPGILQFGTPADDSATGVAVDGAGNVYISGWTNGDLFSPNQGGRDAWVAKFDSGGNPLWTVQFGTPADDAANAVAIDSFTGTVYVAGYTQGNLPFGALTGIADAFLGAFDPNNGGSLWFQQWGTPAEFGAASGVATCGGFGLVYVSGSHAPPTGQFRSTAFLRSFDGFGLPQWEQMTPLFETGGFVWSGVAADSACNAYVGGIFSLVPMGGDFSEHYVVRSYDSTGNQRWETVGPDRVNIFLGQDLVNAVTVDASGRVYVSGSTGYSLAGAYQGGLDVPGDAWLGTLDSVTGAELRRGFRQVGTAYYDASQAVAVDGAGNAFIAGITDGPMGGPGAEADVNGDIFVAGLGAVLPKAPAITGFTPSHADVGATITINGVNFAGTSAVSFTGATGGFVNVAPGSVSAAAISVVVPAGAGTGKVRVTTPGGTAISPGDFTVP